MIELSRTEKAAQTRARKKGRGYVGPTQLRRFYEMKLRSCKAFRRKRKLVPGDAAADALMRKHLEQIEWHGALEPFEARVLAHLRGEAIPLPPTRSGVHASRAGFAGSVVAGVVQRAA